MPPSPQAADQPETTRKAGSELGVDLSHNGKSSLRRSRNSGRRAERRSALAECNSALRLRRLLSIQTVKFKNSCKTQERYWLGAG
jgi:hypothetical protein